MALRPLLLLLAILLTSVVFAQDTLFYVNGDTIIGQVSEVGKETVSYRTSSAGNQVAITVEKLELERLKLASGQSFVYIERSGMKRSSRFTERINLVSIDFIAPGLDHFTVGYERLLRPRMSLAVKAGYIGLGEYGPNQNTTDQHGALLKFGVSFILPPSRKRIPTDRETHPLAGWYLRPEILLNTWGEDYERYAGYPYGEVTQRQYRTNLGFNVVFGRKVLLGERCAFDLYCGLGYGTQWLNGVLTGGKNDSNQDYRENYAYSHSFWGDYTPLIASGGMMFGYLF
jgi:hypothetical protein